MNMLPILPVQVSARIRHNIAPERQADSAEPNLALGMTLGKIILSHRY
jgi:hypothetical protein